MFSHKRPTIWAHVTWYQCLHPLLPQLTYTPFDVAVFVSFELLLLLLMLLLVAPLLLEAAKESSHDKFVRAIFSLSFNSQIEHFLLNLSARISDVMIGFMVRLLPNVISSMYKAHTTWAHLPVSVRLKAPSLDGHNWQDLKLNKSNTVL